MAILTKIENDLKTALKTKDKVGVSTLRVLLAEIRNEEIALRGSQNGELKDEQVTAIIQREIKKRKEAIQLYCQGKRPELADKEEKETQVLSKYLPQQFSPEELGQIVDETIQEVGAKSPADFGKVMGAAMGKVRGKADGSQVAAMVKKALNSH